MTDETFELAIFMLRDAFFFLVLGEPKATLVKKFQKNLNKKLLKALLELQRLQIPRKFLQSWNSISNEW